MRGASTIGRGRARWRCWRSGRWPCTRAATCSRRRAAITATGTELLGPVIVLGTVAAIAVSFLATLALRCLPVAPASSRRPIARSLAVGLLAVYFLQETGEALLAADHHPVLSHLLGSEGWLVPPLAMSFGGLAALAGSWLDRTEPGPRLRCSHPLPRARREGLPPAGESRLGRPSSCSRPPPLASSASGLIAG